MVKWCSDSHKKSNIYVALLHFPRKRISFPGKSRPGQAGKNTFCSLERLVTVETEDLWCCSALRFGTNQFTTKAFSLTPCTCILKHMESVTWTLKKWLSRQDEESLIHWCIAFSQILSLRTSSTLGMSHRIWTVSMIKELIQTKSLI